MRVLMTTDTVGGVWTFTSRTFGSASAGRSNGGPCKFWQHAFAAAERLG